jgi:hypothetical protein
MAIRIPILTSFDPKGLKSANAAFANLGTQVQSLGRNFAVLGAAAVGVGAFLGKAVGAASDVQESINAVNVAFGQSAAGILEFGETAATALGTSQVAFNNAAVRFSAFADRIVGSGNDASQFIADISVRASDFASVFNIEVAEALGVFQSGLAGEAEPLKRFGINLLDSEVKAYAAANGIGEVGRQLTETEKVQARYGLLMQSTAKTAGDFANTSDGLANSMRIMKSEIADTQAEIGQQLLPVIEEILPVVRELVAEFGTKLLAAVKSVDFKPILTDVVNLATFLITNIETIAKVVAAIFILNTAFKLMAVASGIAKVAIALHTWVTAQLATGMTLATIATNLFSGALRLIPFVAVATGLFLLVDQFNKTKTSIENTFPALDGFQTNAIAAADTWARFTPFLNVMRLIAIEVLRATGVLDEFNEAASRPNDSTSRNRRHALREANRAAGRIGSSPAMPVLPDFAGMIAAASGAGSAAAVTDDFTAELERLAREAEQLAAEANDSMKQIEDQAQAEREQAAAAEQAVLDKRADSYKSFADSVKQLFGQIKDSILSSFNLPTLGNSVNSITRNISKLLERTKNFARNISQLSGLGLNSALLQQVIQAGPMAGSQLAAALVGGGSGFISQINSAYSEFGDLAGGIAGVGTTGAFAGQQTINNYSIEVTGGLATGSDVGRAVVNAIKDYERQSGAAWRG